MLQVGDQWLLVALLHLGRGVLCSKRCPLLAGNIWLLLAAAILLLTAFPAPPRPRPAGPGAQPFLLRSAASFVTRILSVFGLASAPGDFLGFADAASSAAASGGGMEVVLDAFSAFRWALSGLAGGRDWMPGWAGSARELGGD
jgi:hypothetical protein